MTPVRGIVFDKDGTLFDFSSTWEAWAHAFLHRIAQDPDHARRMGHMIGFDVVSGRFSPGSMVIAGTPGEIADALRAEVPGLGRSDLIDVLNAEAARAPQVEVTSLKPFLEGLRARGLALGLVTNDAEMPARAHLGTAGVTGCFDFIAGFDSGFGSKPGPGPLLAFSDQMGLTPADVLMVGDSLHDLEAARAAGMRAVAVLTGLATRETLEAHAQAVLPDIGHLPAWLDADMFSAR